MHELLKKYEFKPNETNCKCEGCQNLNLLEARKIKMFDDEIEEENEIQMAALNERSRLIGAVRKEIDELIKENEDIGARIQQNRKDILAFGEKKFSDLTFIKS